MTMCLLETVMMPLLILLMILLTMKKARSIARVAYHDTQKAWGSPFRPITLVLPSPPARGDYLHPFSGSKAPVIGFNESATATLLIFSGCSKRGPSRGINNNAMKSAVFQEAGFCLPVPWAGFNTPSLTTIDFCHHHADLGMGLLSSFTPLFSCWTYRGGDNTWFGIGNVGDKMYPASDLQATTWLLLREAGQHDVVNRRLATVTLGGHMMCSSSAVPPTKLFFVPFISKEKGADLEIVFGVCLLNFIGRNHVDNGSGGPVAVEDTPCSRSRRSASPEGIWRRWPQISNTRVCSPPPIRRVTSALEKARSIARVAYQDTQKGLGSPFRPITLVLPSPPARGDYLHPFSGSKAPVIGFNESATATLLIFSGCCKHGPSRGINNNAMKSAVFQEAGFCLPIPWAGFNTPSLTIADLGMGLLSSFTPLFSCWTYRGGDNTWFGIGNIVDKMYPASDLQATTWLLLREAGQHDVVNRRLATVTLGGHMMCSSSAVPPTKLFFVPFITKEKGADLEIVFGVCLLNFIGRNHVDNGSGGPVAVEDTPCSRSRRSASPEGIWRRWPQISNTRVCSPPPIRRVTSRSSPTSSRNHRLGMENVPPGSSSTPLRVFSPASSQSSRVASEKYRLAQSKKRSDSSAWFTRLGAIFPGRSTKRPNDSRRVVRVVMSG